MERLYKSPSGSSKGGSKSVSGSSSRSFDYAGFDDHIKRQDSLASARDQKKAALYGGSPVQAMLAGNRVRELVGLLRRDAPGTTERDPHQFKTPLSRVTSESSSYSQSSDPGSYSYEGEQEHYRSSPPAEQKAAAAEEPPPAPPPPAPPPAAPVQGPAPPPPPVPVQAAQPAEEEMNIFEDPRFNGEQPQENAQGRYMSRLRRAMYA